MHLYSYMNKLFHLCSHPSFILNIKICCFLSQCVVAFFELNVEFYCIISLEFEKLE